jgi:hypothetical protein
VVDLADRPRGGFDQDRAHLSPQMSKNVALPGRAAGLGLQALELEDKEKPSAG